MLTKVIQSGSKIPKLRFSGFSGEWEEKRLGDVCDISAGKTKSKYITLTGENIIVDMGGISSDGRLIANKHTKYSKDFLTTNDLVMPKDDIGGGFIIGRVSRIPINNKYICGDHIFKLTKLQGDIGYLFYAINSFKIGRSLRKKANGTAQLGLGRGSVENQVIPFPILSEQQKIAGFLESIDKWIENLRTQKESFELYKKGMMQKIFSQEIRFKNENGKDFPKWDQEKLKDIAKFRRGSFPQPYGLRKWYDDENGFPFVQVFDVDDNFKLKNNTKRKISDEAKELSVLTEKGTIVLTIQGSIGRIALTQYDACVDRTLLIFESFKRPINKVFFMYIVFLLFEIEKTKAPGGTIKTITKEVLSNFKLLIPCLAEQQKIADFLTSIDKLIESKQQQVAQAEQWKRGLMQQMFV